MTRTLHLAAVIVALAAAGCGDSPAEPSTAETTTTPATVPFPPEGPDFDGDGTTDTLSIRQGDDGVWVAEVAWGSGDTEPVDLELEDPATIGPLWPAGWADVDGDGTDEAFAVVFAGAGHVRLGMFTLMNGKLTRVIDDTGARVELHVSPGYTFTAAFDCPGDGTILVHEYVRDPEVWRHSIVTLHLDGAVLTGRDARDAEPVPLEAEIPPFTCGRVAPFGAPDR